MQPQLIETIRFEAGKFHNLAYHQARMQRSRQALFGTSNTIDLAAYLHSPTCNAKTIRCRVTYAQEIEKVEYFPYTPKPIEQLKIVPSDIDYRYKYADRSALDQLLRENPFADEIIIEKEGLLTDTTIANIALFREGKWYTPQTPLLEGTMRQKLLDEGLLHPKNITSAEIKHYSHVALMNAMLGFKILNKFTIT